MKTSSTKIYGLRKSILLITALTILMTLLQSCSGDGDDPSEMSLIDFDYITLRQEVVVEETSTRYYDDNSSSLKLDFFEVQNTTSTDRPLIILAPGGGWRNYNQVDELQALAKNLAKRGYAVAVVEYTVNQPDGETWVKALKDFKVAIKYFKKYADDYNIDPDKIFTGGWSTGAQLALYAQHLEIDEFNAFGQEIIKHLLDPEIERLGYEPTIYADFTSKVKGNLLMMPYAWKEDFMDNEGPMMLIANERSEFGDGTIIWGNDVNVGGIVQVGPDVMEDTFEELGLVGGRDLELIITDPSLDSQMEHINYTPLHSSHFEAIADFFHRNL